MPESSRLNLGLSGYTGRMGKSIRSMAENDERFNVVAGLVRSGCADAGLFTTSDPVELFIRSDVVVDFSSPQVTGDLLAANPEIPMVIGTTGLEPDIFGMIDAAARLAPIVYTQNTSIGVTLLSALVEQAAAKLGNGWDIEILETHHRNKIDAPSGTALLLGRAAAAGRDIELEAIADWARHGRTGQRENGHIGFAVRRGGDVVGEHAVTFYGAGERIELSHLATDRALFARGALAAARWVADKPPGLYTMRDVLGL